jgi:DNA-binding MarR family transcriptional regulator
MNRLSNIGNLLKKTYRIYSQSLLAMLKDRGFSDLRASFLEILSYLCEFEGASIKDIGHSCGLKKQTMTSHLNELEKRGYVQRRVGLKDKRQQKIFLTEYGEKFKLSLIDVTNELSGNYAEKIGDVELERIEHTLTNFHSNLN